MIGSTDKAELFTALSKAQGEFKHPKKNAKGHNFEYADMPACIDATRQQLAKNGLAVTQVIMNGSDGKLVLETYLVHSTGQYICSRFDMVDSIAGMIKDPAQRLGATVTYMKRYAYCSILGIAQSEDSIVESEILSGDDIYNFWQSKADQECDNLDELTEWRSKNGKSIISAFEGFEKEKLKLKKYLDDLTNAYMEDIKQPEINI